MLHILINTILFFLMFVPVLLGIFRQLNGPRKDRLHQVLYALCALILATMYSYHYEPFSKFVGGVCIGTIGLAILGMVPLFLGRGVGLLVQKLMSKVP